MTHTESRSSHADRAEVASLCEVLQKSIDELRQQMQDLRTGKAHTLPSCAGRDELDALTERVDALAARINEIARRLPGAN